MKQNPRIAAYPLEEQKKIYAELAKINEITNLIWETQAKACLAFDQLGDSKYDFVSEKKRRLRILLEDTMLGIEETIILLPTKP